MEFNFLCHFPRVDKFQITARIYISNEEKKMAIRTQI